MERRNFIRTLTATGALPLAAHAAPKKSASTVKPQPTAPLSPPVVQTPTESSFSVSWMVSGMATGWVEWGVTPDLGQTATPAHHGLADLSEYALSAKVTNIPKGPDPPLGTKVFYRVVTVPIKYNSAYSIERGEPIIGETRQLTLPSSSSNSASLVVVNDTHNRSTTIASLATRIEQLKPDALVWNGDAANTFESPQQVAQICLTPGQQKNHPCKGGWAATRPLLFTPGNHEARGMAARALPSVLIPWALESTDPAGLSTLAHGSGHYCFAKRIGPIAIIGLDTGEDKPDSRNVWGGMAAYEPYREAQKEWLVEALKRPEISSAPYLITACHIPLRGRKGDNDGMGETGYAAFSGFGQHLWLDLLIQAGCQMLISGHTHQHRIDQPSKLHPIYQVVGGGPTSAQASLISIKANQTQLTLTLENLSQQKLGEITLAPRSASQ